ncbi:MAG: hypothetical protein K5867_01705 [Bacteroidales bacterium]|jgi:uncharacterized membrane protein YjdF|nr:hypothetical protein [Bacteroidales bacterium]
MKKLFQQNSVYIGILAELLSIVVPAVLLYVVLLLLNITPMSRIRWFAGVFIPGILVVRAYAKKKEFPKATKASVVTFFVCFIGFMVYLGMTRQLL